MKRRLSLLLLVFSLMSLPGAHARVDASFDIGLNVFPSLEPVPGLPVYWAPGVAANYFYYDGLYWLFRDDAWYASTWYDGPWDPFAPLDVPLYVLRVPVRYYARPPTFFAGADVAVAPRWGGFFGAGWSERRAGWDRWDARDVPRPAPLPLYQRGYAGRAYPRTVNRQVTIRQQNFVYEPHETIVRQYFGTRDARVEPRPSAPARADANAVANERAGAQARLQAEARKRAAAQPVARARSQATTQGRPVAPRPARHEPQRPAPRERCTPRAGETSQELARCEAGARR